MLSAAKHLVIRSERRTITHEMFRCAQHDRILIIGQSLFCEVFLITRE